MGIVSSMAFGGALAAQKDTAGYMEKSILADEAKKALAERDARLNDYARSMKIEVDQSFQKGERIGGEQAAIYLEQGVRQPFQKSEREAAHNFTKAEGALNRDLQTALAGMREEGADSRHRESQQTARAGIAVQIEALNLAKSKETLIPRGDGTFVRQRADGTVIGTLMEPDGTKPLQGPRDMAKGAELIIGTYNRALEGITSELRIYEKKEMLEPADKAEIARLKERQAFYIAASERLAGVERTGGATPPAALPRGAFDGKRVTFGGTYIGDATNDADARKMIDAHARKVAPSAPPAPAAPAAPAAPGFVNSQVGPIEYAPAPSPNESVGRVVGEAVDVVKGTAGEIVNRANDARRADLEKKAKAGTLAPGVEMNLARELGIIR